MTVGRTFARERRDYIIKSTRIGSGNVYLADWMKSYEIWIYYHRRRHVF
jgi:hypothetical protein